MLTMEKSLYEVLGLGRKASLAEIRSAYRKLAARYHPDRHSGEEHRFLEINGAYLTLSDPQKRQDYDRTLPAAGVARKKTLGDQIEEALRRGVRKPPPQKRERQEPKPRPVSKRKSHETWAAPRSTMPIQPSVAFRDFSSWAKGKIREEFGHGVGNSRWEPRQMSAQDFVDHWITPMGFVPQKDILSWIDVRAKLQDGSEVPSTFFLDPGPPVRIWGKHRAVRAARNSEKRVTVYVRVR